MSHGNERKEGLPSPSDDELGSYVPACPVRRLNEIAWQQWWEHTYLHFADGLERYAQRLLRRYAVSTIDGEEPRDLVQGFFWTLMDKDGLRNATEIHNMNAWVYTAFWRYMRGRHRRSTAQRRRPQGGIASLDNSAHPAARAEEPVEPTFVQQAVDTALDALQVRQPRYAAVIADLIEENDGGRTSPSLVNRLGIAARNLASLKHRARRLFGELFLRALDTVGKDRRRVHSIQRRFLPWSLGTSTRARPTM